MEWQVIFDPDFEVWFYEQAESHCVGRWKAGQKRWYQENIPIADQRFREHLQRLKQQED